MQRRLPHHRPGAIRRGTAAVELALLLPFLAFPFVVGVDYSRLFYHYLTVTNCARNGALYACDPVAAADSPYTSVQQPALADAANLSPTPTVTSTNGTDADGNAYVEVTVSYQFQTITSFPGFGGTVGLQRTVRMRVAPATPN